MARLSKEDLADRSRYKFESREVEIPELGGSVEVRTLSVEERDELPDLVKPVLRDGKPVYDDDGQQVTETDASIEKLAATWAAVVSDPKLTADEAADLLRPMPAPVLDRVIAEFGKLLGEGKEEAENIRSDFRPETD